jgi:hypothetical protein
MQQFRGEASSSQQREVRAVKERGAQLFLGGNRKADPSYNS